jgi:hypothetical protein
LRVLLVIGVDEIHMAVHARKQEVPSGLFWLNNVSKDSFATTSTPWQRSVVARRARHYFDKAREERAIKSELALEEREAAEADIELDRSSQVGFESVYSMRIS